MDKRDVLFSDKPKSQMEHITEGSVGFFPNKKNLVQLVSFSKKKLGDEQIV